MIRFSVWLALELTPQPSAPSVEEFLKSRMEVSDEEWASVESGAPLVKLRPRRDDSETRLLGIVKIQGEPEEFVERYRDIVAFEKGTGVLQIGRFGNPPRVEDLAALTLEADDLSSFQDCRPGDCAIKLSEGAMAAFEKIPWEAADASERANDLARRMIVDFLESYRAGGNAALGVRHDKKEPLLVCRQFEEMMEDPDLPVLFPELVRFLTEYPEASLPGGEEFFYWSKVDFGLKPVIRLNHVGIYRPESGLAKYVMASKMIYTTHYFNTGIEIKFLAQDPGQSGSYYLLAGNRSRSDGLTGFTGAMISGKIRGKAREGLESYLRSVAALAGRRRQASLDPKGRRSRAR